MKTKGTILYLLVTTIGVVSGCGGAPTNRRYSAGTQVFDEYICQLLPGVSTLVEVKKALGPPQTERQEGINKVMAYNYSETDGDELTAFEATSFRFDSMERLLAVSRANLEGDDPPNCDSL